MRISDWSSDVCSSDLGDPRRIASLVRRKILLQRCSGEVSDAAKQVDLPGCADARRPTLRGAVPAIKRCLIPRHALQRAAAAGIDRSEEHTSELQSLMRISYAVFCLKKKTIQTKNTEQ